MFSSPLSILSPFVVVVVVVVVGGGGGGGGGGGQTLKVTAVSRSFQSCPACWHVLSYK